MVKTLIISQQSESWINLEGRRKDKDRQMYQQFSECKARGLEAPPIVNERINRNKCALKF